MNIYEYLFGDKQLLESLKVVLIPIVIQNFVNSLVALLDNVMVGQTGTLSMSGVSIANQLINIFNMLTFGGMAAVGIFLAQYKGKEDKEGIQNCFKLKSLLALLIISVSSFVFVVFGKDLILMFLRNDNNDLSVITETLNYAYKYMMIMLPGLILFELSFVISSTFRECGDTKVAMVSTVCAVILNALFNYILIFGKFGFKAYGSDGAAYATVISRVVEFAILLMYLMKHKEFSYLLGSFNSLHVPRELVKNIIIKGSPLIINELFYSLGTTFIIQCYSTRGLDAIAAFNINNTVNNLFLTVCYAMGNATSIIIGQILGSGELDRAKTSGMKLLIFNFLLCLICGIGLLFCVDLFPSFYNTSSEIRSLSAALLIVSAIHMPCVGAYMSTYFIIRSGGKTLITFLFDGFSSACICYPIAYLMAYFTGLTMLQMYSVICFIDVFKIIIGIYLVNKGIWIQNLVNA